MHELSATFQNIIDTIDGSVPPSATIPHTPDDAVSALQKAISSTIMPRRLTVRAENGSRLSVVTKNRRIIKVAEVHPLDLWNFETSPLDIKCVSDYESFAHPFASTLVKVIGGEPIQIDQALVGDPIGNTGAGYPVSMLAEHVEQSQKRAPAANQVTMFFDVFPNLARARFGDENAIEIPDVSSLNSEWFETRIDGVQQALSDKETDLRFLVLDGETPQALAMVWLDGAGCLVVAEDKTEFDTLEQKLNELRRYL